MGDDPNPAPRKFPYKKLAAKNRWRLEIQNTYQVHSSTWYSYTRYQVSGMKVFFSARSFGELDVAGERTSRTSPQIFEQSPENLCGDEDLL